jgi:hypothetical protein
MVDLKPYMDAVFSAAEKVQLIAQEIDVLMTEGSDESIKKAMALRPDLEAAEQAHDGQVALYEAMEKAGRPNDIARNFIPVSSTPLEPGEGSQPTVIKRADYNKLSLVDRALFVKSGGTVED